MALVRCSAIVQDALNSTSAVLRHCAGSMHSTAPVQSSAIVQVLHRQRGSAQSLQVYLATGLAKAGNTTTGSARASNTMKTHLQESSKQTDCTGVKGTQPQRSCRSTTCAFPAWEPGALQAFTARALQALAIMAHDASARASRAMIARAPCWSASNKIVWAPKAQRRSERGRLRHRGARGTGARGAVGNLAPPMRRTHVNSTGLHTLFCRWNLFDTSHRPASYVRSLSCTAQQPGSVGEGSMEGGVTWR